MCELRVVINQESVASSWLSTSERLALEEMCRALRLYGGKVDWEEADVDGLPFALIHRHGLMILSAEWAPDRSGAVVRTPEGIITCFGDTLEEALRRKTRCLVLRYRRQTRERSAGLWDDLKLSEWAFRDIV